MSSVEPEYGHPETPPGTHPEAPEHRESRWFAIWWVAGSVGGWISPLAIVAFTIGWSLLIYWLIGERTTYWKYGVFPYVPGQTIYDIGAVPSGKSPKQVEYPAAVRGRMRGM